MKSHPDMTADDYFKRVTQLNDDLSKAVTNPDPQTAQRDILAQLRKLDTDYVNQVLKAQDNSVKTILFTRHGLSSDAKKKFGFNPNAAISRDAINAMSITENITRGLFEDDQKTKIYVSPMLRALQTASMIIPPNFKGNIEVTSSLTEKSEVPSGKDIRARSDLGNMGFFGKVANVVYGSRIDNFIVPERNKVMGMLANKSGNLQDANQKTLADDVKVQNIQADIDSTSPGQVQWNICHGKISQKFLNDTLGYETKFGFGETKKIIYYKDQDGEEKAFIPPYSIVINQKTGLLESKPEGNLLSAQDLHQQELTVKRSDNELKIESPRNK